MIKKITRKDLSACPDCACFNIRKASRVVTQVYEEMMHDTGLRSTQFTVLVMVAANESITITQLAEKLVMDRTSLTRNLKPLEKQQLIEIVPGGRAAYSNSTTYRQRPRDTEISTAPVEKSTAENCKVYGQ